MDFLDPEQAAGSVDPHTKLLLICLGAAIRERREDQCLSVPQLAFRVGLAPPQLLAIEAGRLDPSYNKLHEIACALELEIPELAFRAEEIEDAQ